MTDLESQVLTIFRKMNRKDRQTAIKLAILALCPDFVEAMREATPTGKNAPPWEVTKRLVAEWEDKV